MCSLLLGSAFESSKTGSERSKWPRSTANSWQRKVSGLDGSQAYETTGSPVIPATGENGTGRPTDFLAGRTLPEGVVFGQQSLMVTLSSYRQNF